MSAPGAVAAAPISTTGKMHPYEALAKLLEQAGVDTVFGGSGEADAVLLIALKRSSAIKTVTVRNEQAASFMACGYAMFSQKLGVCFSTAGPGEFNLLSGLAVALSDSLPVLAISGYVAAQSVGKGGLNEASGLNRTPDSHAIFAATTKKNFVLRNPRDTCDVFEEAINVAFAGRPGPVHVHVPADVADEFLDNYRAIQIKAAPVLPATDAVAEMADILSQALLRNEKVLALLGYGVIRGGGASEMLEFLERYQIPFVTTMDAKGVLPEDHPLSLGVFGTSGDAPANEYFKAAGTVLAVGNSFAQNASFGFSRSLYEGKTLLHVNIDPHEIGKVYKPNCGLVSDARHGVAALAQALAARAGNAKLAPPDNSGKHNAEKLTSTGSKLHPGRVAQLMSDHLPAETIVLADAGAHMLWLSAYLKLAKGQIFQNPGSFGPMASGVNAAIGVKCANPGKPVVVGCGDGGYLMGGFELLTAVHNNIPVTWVIFNNGELNIVKYFQQILHGDTAFSGVPNPDFVAYASACGALGFRAQNEQDFVSAFQQALSSNRPCLIDAVVDGDVYPPYLRSL